MSSAYRDRDGEIPKLFDGDLETAWNSKTDDRQGAWIDVRVPEGASVTSIEMTAGYTKTDGHGTDLFTGNHRVARVRITHGGQELATHALDTGSRELQTIPVSGPGGIYRIEIAEVTAGERSDWKETCISELRVMGRVPRAQEGFFPRWSIGSLPEPRIVPARPNDDALRLGTHQFATAWDQDGAEDLSEVASEVEDAALAFKDDAQTTTRRVLRMQRPSPPAIQTDWDAMRPSLELAQRTCGW